MNGLLALAIAYARFFVPVVQPASLPRAVPRAVWPRPAPAAPLGAVLGDRAAAADSLWALSVLAAALSVLGSTLVVSLLGVNLRFF